MCGFVAAKWLIGLDLEDAGNAGGKEEADQRGFALEAGRGHALAGEILQIEGWHGGDRRVARGTGDLAAQDHRQRDCRAVDGALHVGVRAGLRHRGLESLEVHVLARQVTV